VSVVEFHSKRRVGQRVGDHAFHLYGFFFRQGFNAPSDSRLANCAETGRLLQRDSVSGGDNLR
jgi:hypothetical protein